jgi:hypothetical protein
MSKAKKDQPFYAYYDTIEETGEVIYCGKGTDYRSSIKYQNHIRNQKYNNIKNKHKILRIRIPTFDEDLALKLENWLIEYYHTWVDDPLCSKYACNIDGPGTNGGCKSLAQEHKNRIKAKRALQVFSQETLEKMRKARKLRIMTNNKPIIQIDNNCVVGRYRSAFEAEKLTGISRCTIGYCCKGKLKTAGGYIWQYASKDENELEKRS